jgi:hypothetical protein
MKIAFEAKRFFSNRKHLALGAIAVVIAGGTIAAFSTFAAGSFDKKVVDLTVRSKTCFLHMHAVRYVNTGGEIKSGGSTPTKLVQCNGNKDRFGTYTMKVRFSMKHNGRESSYGIYAKTMQGDHFLRKLVSPHTRYTKLYVSR